MGNVLNSSCDKFLYDLKMAGKAYFRLLSCLYILQAVLLFFFYSYIVKALYPLLFNGDKSSLSWLKVAAVLAILRFFVNLAQCYISAALESHLTQKITDRISSNLADIDPAYCDHMRIKPAALTDAALGIVPYFTDYLSKLRMILSFCLILLLLVASVSVKYSLIMMALLPLLPLFMILTAKATRKVAARQFESMARLALKFSEVLSNLAFIHLYNLEENERKKLKRTQRRFASQTMQILKIAFISALALEFVATCSIALCGITLGFDVYEHHFAYDKALLILFICPELFAPLRTLGAGFHIRQKALGIIDELKPVLDYPNLKQAPMSCALYPDKCNDTSESSKNDRLYSIEFKNVTAVYPDQHTAYKNLNFKLEANSLLLLKAPSGSGKTSVLYTLLKWCSIKEGSVLLNSKDLLGLDDDYLFSHIALMPQFPEFFHASIKDNLTLGGDADINELYRIIKLTRTDKIINRLPCGPEYIYDPENDCFSGGEKRLLALARTLLQKKDIYLLDEPTAGLSLNIARQTAKLIVGLKQSHTLIVATHSDLFDKDADMTVTFSGGL